MGIGVLLMGWGGVGLRFLRCIWGCLMQCRGRSSDMTECLMMLMIQMEGTITLFFFLSSAVDTL